MARTLAGDFPEKEFCSSRQNDYDHNCFVKVEKCSKRKFRENNNNRENASSQFGDIYRHVSGGRMFAHTVTGGDQILTLGF